MIRKLRVGGTETHLGWTTLCSSIHEDSSWIQRLNGLDEGSFDLIYVNDFFEHFSRTEVIEILQRLHAILTTDGKLLLSVLDLEALCRLYLDPSLSKVDRVDVVEMIYGSQGVEFRTTGFSEEILQDYLSTANFKLCKRVNSFGYFDDRSTFKLNEMPVSLNLVVYKNQPNEDLSDDFISLYSSGVTAFNENQFIHAFNFFDRAREINPEFAPLWYNLGLVSLKLGNIDDALFNFDRAIHFDPNFTDAIHVREEVSQKQESSTETTHLSYATSNHEDICKALSLQGQGLLDEAEAIYLEVLNIDALNIAALFSLGGIECSRNDHDKAQKYFERVLDIAPSYSQAWYNLGICFTCTKQNDRALECYDHALEINPEYSEVMVNRGALLVSMGRHKDALLNYEELLKKDPGNVQALCNRGVILTQFKLGDLAIETFERLIELSPDYDFAQGLLAFEKMHSCNWDNLVSMHKSIIDGVRAGKKICNSLAFTAISNDPVDQLTCAQIFSNYYAPLSEPLWRGEQYNHKKIKIAYVSPDFREHPVGHLIAGIFEHHDKSKFEIIAISLGHDDQSSLRARMLAAFDQFIDVRNMTSRAIATMIRSMEIDILIDLAGYTADSRTDVFSCRPAPVQVNYLGYSSTMGASYYDYIIADQYIIPEKSFNCYSEKIVYMPETYLPTDSSLRFSESQRSRTEYGLPEEVIVFCSFNHDYKINAPMFDVWMRLLKNTPESVLWLMKLNESAERNLRKEASARGVDPERIIFATRVPSIEDHLARYTVADIFLDTTPCNAHSTATDVLRAGLPIITCRGNTFASRVASGLLTVAGIPELITDSLEEYEELALFMVSNPELLRDVRAKLKKNLKENNPFDTAKYCQNLEKAFSKMQEHTMAGVSAVHIVVE